MAHQKWRKNQTEISVGRCDHVKNVVIDGHFDIVGRILRLTQQKTRADLFHTRDEYSAAFLFLP